MIWPGWGDILPTIVMLVGIGGSVAALFWALMRLFRPLAESVAREACDDHHKRLKENDFRHMEDSVQALGERLDARMDGLDKRMDRMEIRIGERFDRVRQDGKEMEARLMEAILGLRDSMEAT